MRHKGGNPHPGRPFCTTQILHRLQIVMFRRVQCHRPLSIGYGRDKVDHCRAPFRLRILPMASHFEVQEILEAAVAGIPKARWQRPRRTPAPWSYHQVALARSSPGPMVPVFSRKQGDFQEKAGRRLSTNGQSPLTSRAACGSPAIPAGALTRGKNPISAS
jgi:hypothetical protein